MTTASEITIKILQKALENRIAWEASLRDELATKEPAVLSIRVDLDQTVAEREALEADLAALTVAEKVTIPGGDVECPKCHARPGQPCTPLHPASRPKVVAELSHPSRIKASRQAQDAEIVVGSLVYVAFAGGETCGPLNGHAPHKVVSLDGEYAIIEANHGPQSWLLSSLVLAAKEPAVLSIRTDPDRTVAEREALEAEPGPVCSVCALPIKRYKGSPTGWTHEAMGFAYRAVSRLHEASGQRGSYWPVPVGYDVKGK